jgi:CheY-like chemotaxis protein
MANNPKILLVDDEQEVLDLYRDLLNQLACRPEVHASNTGMRAISMLESEPFDLLITDLNMPKMDGLQMLSIVRRKFPRLCIVVLTSVLDEQFRSRAYAMGVDLFWQKPASGKETKLFQECIESLLKPQAMGGFRGVQSKNLVDIIQLECLSRSSSVLRITHRALEGKIWVQDGEVIDASTGNAGAEEAFKEILSWKGGNFEILPHEPKHKRTIVSSYQALLLNTAQAIDESQGTKPPEQAQASTDAPGISTLAALARFEGVEFLLKISADSQTPLESWGVENAEPMALWARQTQQQLRQLGEKLGAGGLVQVQVRSLQGHIALAPHQESLLIAGFRRTVSAEQVQQTMKQMIAKWAC